MQVRTEATRKAHGQTRITTVIDRIEDLVGGHCGALEAIYRDAPPTDPDDLGEAPRGVLLTLAGLQPVHLALRPLVRGLSRGGGAVWQGVRFDHGGNAGVNRVIGGEAARFRAETAPSRIDGAPSLVLTYEKAPWPWKRLRDELRTVSPGLAMGPTFFGDKLILWFGLMKA